VTKLILSEIDKRDRASGGKCGISPIEICQNLGVSYSEIKETLNELNQQQKINVRRGINSFLIFKA
jgi:predicted transcriptional regulator